MSTTDVVVIGAGPAGLAAGIAARLGGLSVLVFDRRRPPLDKACGEGIMPAGVASLARLGVALPPERSIPFRGIRYVESAGGAALEASARFRAAPGIGIRRVVLHEAMARRALDLDVRIYWGATFEGLRPDGVTIDGEALRARWIVGADGQESRVRRAAGLDSPASSRRVGLRRHYGIEPWSDVVEVHWAEGNEAYVTPVAPDQICVAMLSDRAPGGFDAALERFPSLARRLAGAGVASADLGAATLFRRGGRVVSGRVALAGDAAGCVDAMTGDGISLALAQALALGSALRRGDLSFYAADYRRIVRRPNRMTALMLAARRRGPVRRAVLRGLAAVPGLFDRLAALHTGPAAPA